MLFRIPNWQNWRPDKRKIKADKKQYFMQLAFNFQSDPKVEAVVFESGTDSIYCLQKLWSLAQESDTFCISFEHLKNMLKRLLHGSNRSCPWKRIIPLIENRLLELDFEEGEEAVLNGILNECSKQHSNDH